MNWLGKQEDLKRWWKHYLVVGALAVAGGFWFLSVAPDGGILDYLLILFGAIALGRGVMGFLDARKAAQEGEPVDKKPAKD